MDLSAGDLQLTDLEESRERRHTVERQGVGKRDTAPVVHCLVGFLPGDASEVQRRDVEASDDAPGTDWIAKSGLVVSMEVSP